MLKNETGANFQSLYETIATLRSQHGCPWDRAQTPQTLRGDLFEECCEALEAINENDPGHVKEELGDVLLNTVLIAYIYEQEGLFTLCDVLRSLTEKLFRRHPHVFPDSEGKQELLDAVETPEAVVKQWDAIKRNLEGRKAQSVLDEISKGLPPLLKAYSYQKKAAKKGFDWPSAAGAIEKVREEFEEVIQADENLEEEIGDLFFALVNVSRHLHINPEIAMQRANAKFYKRFKFVEHKMAEAGIPMESANCRQMDAFWDEAKKKI